MERLMSDQSEYVYINDLLIEIKETVLWKILWKISIASKNRRNNKCDEEYLFQLVTRNDSTDLLKWSPTVSVQPPYPKMQHTALRCVSGFNKKHNIKNKTWLSYIEETEAIDGVRNLMGYDVEAVQCVEIYFSEGLKHNRGLKASGLQRVLHTLYEAEGILCLGRMGTVKICPERRMTGRKWFEKVQHVPRNIWHPRTHVVTRKGGNILVYSCPLH